MKLSEQKRKRKKEKCAKTGSNSFKVIIYYLQIEASYKKRNKLL